MSVKGGCVTKVLQGSKDSYKGNGQLIVLFLEEVFCMGSM